MANFNALSGDGSELPSPIQYAPCEADGVAVQKERLARLSAKRPAWVNCPANDNQGWPLAEQLRRDGNDALLAVAERYRRTYDAAHTEAPLIGASLDDTYSVDQRVHNRPDGSVGYKGVRRVRSAVAMTDGADGAYKAAAIDEDVRAEVESKVVTFPRKPMKPVSRKWSGDNIIIAAIDAKKLIWHLQDALGPLLEVFEDAVPHGETLSAIGERKGFGTSGKGAAGKALVMMGLEVVQREFHQMERAVAV